MTASKTILLVEDDKITMLTEKKILSEGGFRVITADNAESAVDTAVHGNVDLVLMDIDLGPGKMDGIQAAEIILQQRELPIVFCTSHAEKEIVERVKGITRYGYVIKNSGKFVILETVNMAFNLFEAYENIQAENRERRRSEEQLREQQALLQSIYNDTTVVTVVMDIDEKGNFRYVSVSKAFETITGVPADKLIGKTPHEAAGVFTKEQADKIVDNYRKCLEINTTYDFEERIIVSGKEYWRHTTLSPVRDKDGSMYRVVGATIDISGRKMVEKALRESEARWHFALEGSRQGVWDWNARENTVYFSHQWKSMLGYEDDEIGNTLEEWSGRIHPDDIDRCYAELEEHFQGRQSYYESEHRVRCKDGSYKWILDRGKVIEWMPDGKPLRVIGTHTDITDLKNAVEEKDFLLKEINHRVKNNLSLIKSLVSLKEMDLDGDFDFSDIYNQIEAIRIVHEKLYHAEKITNIDFADYAHELLTTIFSSFTAEPVLLEFDIDPLSLKTKTAIPLGLIINEIATNAIQHGFSAGSDNAVFSIRLNKGAEENLYEMILSNNGNPFPENIEFDNPGSLGLRLIQTLIEQIGGAVELKRSPYPVFTIRFPVSEDGV